MKFSVIIPTFNDWDRLQRCLEALKRQSFRREDFEVIVVNNSFQEGIPVGFEISEDIKVLWEPRAGSYLARNIGAYSAKGEILAFTDSDCIPDIDWLLNGEKFSSEKRCDIFGGPVRIFKDLRGSNIIYRYEKCTAFRQDINLPQGRGVTANLFVRRNIFELMQGFDSNMKSGGDWDLTLRCVERGYIVKYAEQVVVFHPARRSLFSLLSKQRRLICWGIINTGRRYGHSRLRIILSMIYQSSKKLIFGADTNRSIKDNCIVFSIDLIKLLYKIIVGILVLLRLFNPEKVRI